MSKNNMENFSQFFKDPLYQDDDIVAIGGDFSTERLLYAYTHGIFPWSESPIRWYSPNPRAVFDINGLHISKTIKKKIKKKVYSITFNKSFKEVMLGCSYRTNELTWITSGFVDGYSNLHEKGYAHSVEAWDSEGKLVGGCYGVAIGRFFAGESMFSFASDAGKICLSYLFSALEKDGFLIFDKQALNETTWNLGAYEIPKFIYLEKIKEAVKIPFKWEPPQVVEAEEFLLNKFKHSL